MVAKTSIPQNDPKYYYISCFHCRPTCDVLKKAGAAKLFVTVFIERLYVLPAIAIRAVLRIRCIHTVFVAAISSHK